MTSSAVVEDSAEDARDLLADGGAQVRVERGERLVQEQDLGFDRERPREGHALLLAAGELVGVAALQARQPDHLEQLADPLPSCRAGQPEGDVRLHREVRKQAALLGDVADPAPLGMDVRALAVDDLARDPDRAAVGSLEAGEQAQQRRLAAAGRSEDRRQRPRRHLQVEAGEHGVRAEALAQAADLNAAHGATCGCWVVRMLMAPPKSAMGACRRSARAHSSARPRSR